MNLYEYLGLFISVILGGGLAFYVRRNNKSIFRLVLSFSGAYLLGITVLHLMPSVFGGDAGRIGLWVILGFFIQLLLEQMSAGVEHGHIHAQNEAKSLFAIQVMIGLCVHAFMEGIPLSSYHELAHAHHDHAHTHNHLLYGIIIHKAPAAFALVLLLLSSRFSTLTTLVCLFVFAAMSPLGAGLAELLNLESNQLRIVVAVVTGSFLHIATTILFELDGSSHHHFSLKRLMVIALGLVIAIMTMH